MPKSLNNPISSLVHELSKIICPFCIRYIQYDQARHVRYKSNMYVHKYNPLHFEPDSHRLSKRPISTVFI